MKLVDPTIRVSDHPPAHTTWRELLPFWETGRNRQVAIVWLVSLLYSVALAFNIFALLQPPQLRLVLSPPGTDTTRIAWLLPGSGMWEQGVRPGDIVVALDGRLPTLQATGRWTGNQVQIQSVTGQQITVDATIIRQGRSTWPLVALSPWFLLLGTLVYLRAPHRAIGRATYAMFASAAVALVLAPASIDEYVVAVIAEWVAVPLFGAYFALFFLTFPQARVGKHLLLLVSIPMCIVAILSLLTPWFPALYEPTSLLRIMILLGYLLLGVGVLVHSFVSTKDRAARRGLTIISGGTLASVLPFIALYLAPDVLGRVPLVPAEYAILPLVILPASFAYAVLRHQTIDVSLVQRWLVRAMVWSVLLVGYAAMVYTVWQVGEGWLPQPFARLALALGTVLLVGASFGWLRGRLQYRLDRLIFKDTYEYRPLLRALSHDLSTAPDLDTVGQALPVTLRRLMNLDWALLLVQEEHTLRVMGAAGAYQPAMLPELTAAAQGVHTQPQVVWLAYGYLQVLIVPLRIGDTVVGHLCLGPKAKNEPFRPEDHDLLQTLSGQVAGVVHNAQLLRELRANAQLLDQLTQRVQRIRDDERARLSADLHDEPLQTAMQLQRKLAADEQIAASTPYKAFSQTLIDQLRSVCVRLRPAMLEELGLVATLDMYSQEQSMHNDVAIRLEVDPAFDEIEVSPAIETALYRAAQEGISNSLRHARPHEILVRLGYADDMVQLTIADDGTGFEVPVRFNALVEAGHLGLAGLRQRLRFERGSLDIQSQPGRGTILHVAVPPVEQPL